MKLFQNEPKFYKGVFALALPIALQSLISIGVNMLDTIMVGSLGENALSATSLANSFISIYHIFCMGLGMGASVLVSRYWGMKKAADGHEEEAGHALKQTVCLMLRITVGLAALFALATLLMPSLLMKMYTSDEEIIRLGDIYFRWSIITYFFLGTSLVSTIVLRSVGQVRLPLYVSIGAFFVNLGANYAFIFGKFGAPRMEVAGAALGTLIARLFEAIMIVGYLFFVDKKIQFRVKDLFMKTSSLIGEYIRISIPVLISDAILAIGNNSVAMVIGHLGAAFVAANAITSVTQQLSTVVIQGVSQAGAIVTGQTLGLGDKKKTMQQGWMFLGLGFALGALSAIFILAVSKPIISTYNVSEETVNIAGQLMAAISLIIIFRATNSIMTKGVLRGGGDTKMLMLADNIFLWVLSIPFGILAGFVFHWPAFWIYVALKSDDIVKTVWCVIRLRSEKWIKKISTGK
ncbi:putative efflux protein, MATE family [Treponema bryantii]|uniref:Multidrug-efflux transporter n=1 Tax=Treponema bryantii TaxID=163 RepID=A0A1I3L7X7_9SPIR|nr:MATE family efflux transporter [Treponema bryantii]SFI80749.1 putative efflux protein, MATE family [Treponema bryantii]